MPIRIARLFAEIGADQSGLDEGLGQAETKLKQFGQADLIKGGLILGALHKIGRGFVDMGRQAVGSYADFELAGMSLQTLVAQELTATGAARDMSQALGMAGEQARGLQDWIQQLAIKSPFTQTGIRAAFQTALAYGMTTKEAQRLSKAVLDFSAGSGRGEAAMNQVALALGQIQAKGKLAGQEVLQLVNAGIGVDNILAKAFGKTTEEIVNLREKGLIPADLAVQAIVESLEKDFGGAAERAGGSFSGLLSSMKDLKEIGLREFFGATFREIQPMLQDFVSTLQDPRTLDGLRKAGEDLAGVFRGMLDLAEKARQTWDSVDESNKRLLTGLGLTVLLGPKIINFMAGFVGLLSKAAVGVKAWQAGMTLTTALGAAGLSGVAIAAGAAVAALASLVAVGWQWNQQITKTNRVGKEMVSGAWSGFFEEQVRSGKSANEVLKEYQAAQERIREATRFSLTDMPAKDAIPRLFINSKSLAVDMQDLNKALAAASKTFNEYTLVAAEAGLTTEQFSRAQWEAIQAQVEAQKMIFGTEKGMQAYSERWSALAASFGEVNESSYLTAAQLFNVQEEASGYLGSLDQMIQKQGELQRAMQSWNEGTANDLVNMMGNKLKTSSDEYRNALGMIDEVLGTTHLKQLEHNETLQALVDEYAKTGNLDEFRAKLIEVQEEGLASMRQEMEEVTTKAQELYEKLLALPSEIRIKIGFDVENYPGFLTQQTGVQRTRFLQGGAENRATGGTAWAGRVYRWWERGPEFFIPAQNGRIEPVRSTERQSVQVTVNAEVKSDIDIYKLSRRIATEIRRANL